MKETMFVLHMLGLVIGMGAGFVNIFLRKNIERMEPGDRVKFLLNLRPLGRMGIVGLTLLVISGGYLMTPYWRILGDRPALMAKLALVVVLITLITLMHFRWQGAIKNNGGPDLMAIPKLGMIALPTGILIIILAVISFH